MGITKSATILLKLSKDNQISIGTIDNTPKNIKASLFFNNPEARGLFFVRSTLLSMLESKISFITHPHALIIIDPTQKIIYKYIIYMMLNFVVDKYKFRLNPHSDGSIKSRYPKGLLNLPK